MNSWLTLLKTHRAIAVIRASQLETGYSMAKAVAQGGMRLIEITWNSDRPTDLIQQLRLELPHCQIGAGTLLNRDMMKNAITAGAQFLFTPHIAPDLIQLATEQGIPIVPGALSPTEIVSAWQAGAPCVKVFPIQAVGGAEYLRALQGPLGEIPLIPTGGVTLENTRSFLQAGAIAVGLAGSLFPKQAVHQANWGAITQRAKTLTQQLTETALLEKS